MKMAHRKFSYTSAGGKGDRVLKLCNTRRTDNDNLGSQTLAPMAVHIFSDM